MSVRLAEMEDIPAMSYIHSQTWKKTYVDYISVEYLENISDEGWIPIFSRALKEKVHDAAVFEVEGRISGTITFGKSRNIHTSTGLVNVSEDPSEAEIISLYVLPDYWSTGQGYQLVKFAVEYLKAQGFKSCYLWVIRENERATRFYKRFGFKSTGEFITVMLAENQLIEEKYVLSF